MGALVNAVRQTLEEELDKIENLYGNSSYERSFEEEKIDITLPGRAPKTGHIHPLTNSK